MKHTFTTMGAALTFSRQARKRNSGKKIIYYVPVRFSLPTEDDKAFPGYTCLQVTRKQFLHVIKDQGTILVDQRGGKIVITEDNKTSDSLTFISL